MSFLELFGWAIPVAERQSPSASNKNAGVLQTSFGGRHLDSRADYSEQFSFVVPAVTQETAVGIKGLVAGDYHYWGFESDLFSDDGVPYLTGSNGAQSGATVKKGTGSLSIVTGNIQWAPRRLGTAWTVLVWRYDGATWKHHAVNSSGDTWEDGVLGAFPAAWLTVVAGVLQLDGAAGVFYDSMMLFLFKAPAEQVEAHYAWEDADVDNSFDWNLRASGDFSEVDLLCEGIVDNRTVMNVAAVNNREEVSFSLDVVSELGIDFVAPIIPSVYMEEFEAYPDVFVPDPVFTGLVVIEDFE